MGDLLDAYRADLTNAGKETFSAWDALWLQCGVVLQRALELEPGARQSCLASGLPAILDDPWPASVIEALHKIRAPFNVTTAGQQAAIAALGDTAFVDASRTHNRQWRTWFEGEIATLGNKGLRAVPSKANFSLVLFNGALTAERAYKGLMDAGYIVRWLPGQGLPNALRITIGTEAETTGLMASLRKLVEAAG